MNRVERAALIRRLRRDAERIAAHFSLEYRAIEAERRGVKARYGACYEDGLIKIRLQHAKSGEQLKYSSLIDTLCHELAHLKHFDHGKEFKRFYLKILRWARRQGIYRPRSRRPGEEVAPAPPRFVPERKNGVPVFAVAPDPASRPGWMKAILETSRARPEPVEDLPEKKAEPAAQREILPLFATLAEEPQRASKPRRAGAGRKARAEQSREARERQLSLF